MIRFTLPRVLPTSNPQLRSNHWARRRARSDLAWEIAARLGPRPAEPIIKARVTVYRYSIRLVDPDGLYGTVKDLLDVMCPSTRTHPFGLGLMFDDDAEHCELTVKQFKVPHVRDVRTEVTVENCADDVPIP